MLNACARKQPGNKQHAALQTIFIQFIFNLFTLSTNKQHWAIISTLHMNVQYGNVLAQMFGSLVVNKPTERCCCASDLPKWHVSHQQVRQTAKYQVTALQMLCLFSPAQACLVLSGPLSAGSSKRCWQGGFPRDHGWITEQAYKAQTHTPKRSGGSESEHLFESLLSKLMELIQRHTHTKDQTEPKTITDC